MTTGWWLGTCFLFSNINFIIPTDELIFFRGVKVNHQAVENPARSACFEVPLHLQSARIEPGLSGEGVDQDIYPLALTNIAMGNCLFIDGLPMVYLLKMVCCFFSHGYVK